MDFERDVARAIGRIGQHIRKTPLEFSPFLSEETGARVHLKLENQQESGSFKLRGAMNKLLVLDEEQRGRGVICASTGNHGLAVATGAEKLGCVATVFAPRSASGSKLAGIRLRGSEIRFEGDDCVLAERAARSFAEAEGLAYISPYNDADVVAGQGTIAYELADQLDRFDAVFVSVGGGGLIAGIGGYLEAIGREVDVVGCSPSNSAVMHASLEAGRVLDMESLPTLSDGTAGGMEADSITFELCRELIDRFTLLGEDEIRNAVRDVVSHHHMLIEGAAGAAIAGMRQCAERYADRDVVVVLCGANIGIDVLGEIL